MCPEFGLRLQPRAHGMRGFWCVWKRRLQSVSTISRPSFHLSTVFLPAPEGARFDCSELSGLTTQCTITDYCTVSFCSGGGGEGA